MNHFNKLLLIDRSFFLVVLFKEFLQLVLLLIKLVVQFLILCKFFLYSFVVLYVGLRELKSMISGFFVQLLNLKNLRSREAKVL